MSQRLKSITVRGVQTLDGLIKPIGSNEWLLESGWTVSELTRDIVWSLVSKGADFSSYGLFLNGSKIAGDTLASDLPEGAEVTVLQGV